MFLLPSVVLISTAGFKNSAFSRYYSTALHITDEMSGYMFLPFAAGFFIAAPIYGILVERGFGAKIEIGAQIAVCLMMFCFFIPSLVSKFETVYYILVVLFIYGTTQSSPFNPHYLIMERICISEGYTSIPGTCFFSPMGISVNSNWNIYEWKKRIINIVDTNVKN